MKIIAFSDSHGDHMPMIDAMKKHKNAEIVVFCGDGYRDIIEVQKQFPNKTYFCVKGNCDWYCDFANLLTTTLGGKKILVTHGHIQRVKESLMHLAYLGRQENANIIFYGHTHDQLTVLEDNMILVNPGSISYANQYATVEIDENTGETTVKEFPPNKFGTFKVK